MRDTIVRAIGRLLRLIPASMPGKYRLADAMLAPLGRGPAVVKGAFDLLYHCPSLAEPIVRGIVRDGLYEPATHAALCAHLPPQGVFLDIGANIGALCLPVARARPDCRVYAIEASPTIAANLSRNIATNSQANVIAFNMFIGATDGATTEFYNAPSEKFGMGSAGAQFGAEATVLPVRTIDAMLAEGKLPPPDVIKLDIEGAEYLALKGGESLLSSPRPPRAVIFEFADWAERRLGLAIGASQTFLMERGYRLYDVARPKVELQQPVRAGTAMLLAISDAATSRSSVSL